MAKILLSALLFWTGLSASAFACTFLPVATVQQAVGTSEMIEQRAEQGRCHFTWKKTNWQTIEAKNQERIKYSMRRGQNGDQTRVSVWAKISAEIILTTPTEALAKQSFQNYLGQNFTQAYGSPDPLQSGSWEAVSAVKGQAAWNKQNQQLLLQKDQRLTVLTVDVAESPEQNLALALQLSSGLHF